MMVQDRELLTVQEAAEALGIPEAKIRDWIRRRRITVYKPQIGRLTVDIGEIREKLTPRRQPND